MFQLYERILRLLHGESELNDAKLRLEKMHVAHTTEPADVAVGILPVNEERAHKIEHQAKEFWVHGKAGSHPTHILRDDEAAENISGSGR